MQYTSPSSRVLTLTALFFCAPLACPASAAVPVRVGIYQNAPKVYLDTEGKPAGFFPEILDHIAHQEGWDIEYVPCVWNDCLDKVERGELDLMMDVAFSESRANRFDFNEEMALGNWSRVYTRKDVSIRSILDMDRRRIAVLEGSIQANRLKADARILGITPIVTEVESFAAVFDLVEKGEVDAGIVNRLFGAQQMMNFGLQETGLVLGPSELMFIAPKGSRKGLLERIDEHLIALKKDPESIYYAALKRATAPAARPIPGTLLFTAEETAWLAAHHEITIAINEAWPPMDYVNDSGDPQGIGVGFIGALNTRLDGRLSIVPLPWSKMYAAVKNKQIDALMDITPTPDRDRLFIFTEPYSAVPHVIVAPKDAPYYANLSQLEGKVVGVERDFFMARVLREEYPKITLRLFETTSDALDAASKGEIDAYVGNRAVATYIIEQELIPNLKEHGKLQETASTNAIGVRNDYPILRDILQKALDDVSAAERRAILRDWIHFDEDTAALAIRLSPEERSWLADHPVLRLGYSTDWPPVESVDSEGCFIGLSADFARKVSEILGIAIEPADPQNWQTTMEEIKEGSIDILFSATRTPEREEFLLFSKPYLRFPIVIVTDESVPYIGTLEELVGKRAAVVEGYAIHDILTAHHPSLELVPTKDVAAGLNAVIRRDADVFIGSFAAVSHVIGREGMSGLKVSGGTPYSYELSVAVHKDQPILARVIQKALDAIPEEERNAIFRSWISVTYERGVHYGLLWKVLLGSVLVVFAVFFWNRRLAREIGLREKAESELVEAKDAAESANLVKSAFLASMSHELRTPLNSIVGFTSIILNELAGPLNLEQKKQLRMVKGSAHHLLNLINDVLDISKIEAGELEVVRGGFSMRFLVIQVAESLKPLAEQKGLSLSVEVSPDVDMLISDERRVRQVLINLVNNAVKFTESGGVKISCRRCHGYIEVEVRDSGIGIRHEDMDKLFMPFQQLDTGISRKYEGTGLGLSICERILDLLGGTIRAKSRFGKGSVFTVTLPLRPEEQCEQENNSRN